MAWGLETMGGLVGGMVEGAGGTVIGAGAGAGVGALVGGGGGLVTAGPAGAVVGGGGGVVAGAVLGGGAGMVLGAQDGVRRGREAGKALSDWIFHADQAAEQHPDEPTDQCAGQCGHSAQPPFEDVPGRVPFKGRPNSTVRGPKQSRTYGPDGYPQTNRDEPHQSESGIGNGDHSQDWSRPADGGPPTSSDRGPPRLPQPGDPPPPRGFGIP